MNSPAWFPTRSCRRPFAFIAEQKDMVKIKFTRRGRAECGAAAVEFAIVISLLVLILGGIIEFGRVLWYLDALTKATRDGARYLSTAAKPLDSGAAYDKAREIVVKAAKSAAFADQNGVWYRGAGLPGFDISNVIISCDPSCALPNQVPPTTPYYVTVSINNYSVAFGSWFAMPLPSGDWPLTPHTTMRYMCTESGKSC